MLSLTLIPVPVFKVICPECRSQTTIAVEPDAPHNDSTGVYCLFCDSCRYAHYHCLVKKGNERKRVKGIS